MCENLIQKYAEKFSIPPNLLKAQIKVESNFDFDAISPEGAIGFMQIMPDTAADLGVAEADLYDPEKNIACGSEYLKIQFDHFNEIPDLNERWKFALGAYNGGRGYINKALQLARQFEKRTISQPGHWQQWIFASQKLSSKFCKVRGKHPDWKQIQIYVAKVWRIFKQYEAEQNV